MRYYSFFVGTKREHASKWKFKDVKIMADSPRNAIIVHQFLLSGCRKNFKPSWYLITTAYRGVQEFELLENHYPSRMNFKKLKFYTQHQIDEWFSKDLE